MTTEAMMGRRELLGWGLRGAGTLAVAGIGGGLLAACSSSKSTVASQPPAASKSLGSASLQLNWIKNFEFDGSYVADSKGYYRDAGVDVALLSGGPSISSEPLVVSGKALVGISSPDLTAAAINQGAPLKIVGACYQKSPFAMMSLASDPITTPQAMVGKKIGIQPANQTLWQAFLKLNKLDPASIPTVPVGFDQSPLVTGDVKGFFAFSNDDPIVLASKGVKTSIFLFADFGYKLFTQTYIVANQTLADASARAKAVALLRGEIRGWQQVIADPALGAQLTVDVYGKDLGLAKAEQQESSAATNALMESDVTRQHGLFWMTPETIGETIATLAVGKIKATPDMFSNELLQDAYQGHTRL